MSHKKPLHIGILADMAPGKGAGGVSTVISGLVSALGMLEGAHERYSIFTSDEFAPELRKRAAGNQRVIVRPPTPRRPLIQRSLRRILRPLKRAVIVNALGTAPRQTPTFNISDGFVESFKCDVVHIPYQWFTLYAAPTIYSPHDIQHVHFPQFFTAQALAMREAHFRAGCQISRLVVTASQWVRDDITSYFSIDPKKVITIPWAPLSRESHPLKPSFQELQKQHQIRNSFFLYPAATWEHKNHIRLLQALAEIRSRDRNYPQLVCTGALIEPHWTQIRNQIRHLQLESDAIFLGHISAAALHSLYCNCTFVIVPSLFEAASFPVFEAWSHKAPVACSTVTSLPRQTDVAALQFEPHSVNDIAQAIRVLANDERKRKDLIAKGTERLSMFTWSHTARAYRAAYRLCARKELQAEDVEMLQQSVM